jgi:hypothetical protein
LLDSGALVAELEKIELVEALEDVEQRLRGGDINEPIRYWDGLRAKGAL